MQIQRVNNTFNPNFEAIKIKNINPEYSRLRTLLEKELEEFSKRGDNAELLGKGLSSSVYKFLKLDNIVFKKSHKKKTDFANEIGNLKKLPKGLKTVQRYIAQAFDDETGIFYLISTKMKGKEANSQNNPWSSKHLKSFFDTLFELDKNGIYHGDFNLGNILLDKKGKANLIDFQWMQTVDRIRFFENKPKSLIPPFMLCENSQMFEMASFPYYIEHCPDAKNFLKEYLKEKSVYHFNRGNYLSGIIGNWPYVNEKSVILKGINYENAQALLFRFPDEDLLKTETKKLQFLSTFREAFSQNEPNNPLSNFITSCTSHLLVLSSIQDLRAEIAAQKARKYLSSAKRDYLKCIDEYAKYWFDSVKGWLNGILENSIKQAENVEHSDIVIPENFENLINISKCIDENYKPKYTKGFDLAKNTDSQANISNIESSFTKFKKLTISIPYDWNVNVKIDEIKRINEKLKKAIKENRGIDVVNLSILNIAKNRELKKLIIKNHPV